jgi:hypothetical protein
MPFERVTSGRITSSPFSPAKPGVLKVTQGYNKKPEANDFGFLL